MTTSGAAPLKNTFGEYEILSVVGFGGMGVVYRAFDPRLNRTVALKVLKEDLLAQPAVRARFQREAKAVAQLNHPNIVHIYSVGTISDIPYMAMELIEGRALSLILHKEKRLPWERALYVTEQIARGLACAHAEHVIHRDIKPGNVLIGIGDHALLTDFGIAKILTDETQLTIEGSRLGTPDYMSPERCENAPLTPASDIYSVGVMLFQMLTGRLPFEAPSSVELIKKIISGKPARVSEYHPDVPRDVDRLVAWMLERKPANRPANAELLAMAAARVRKGEPLDEHDVSTAVALEEFRLHTATPTPRPATRQTVDPGVLGRAMRYWRRMSTVSRIGAVALSLALVCTLAYTAARYTSNLTLARREAAQTAWQRSGRPALFSAETPGVTLAKFSMDSPRPAAIHGTSSDSIAVTLGNGNQRTLVLLSPPLQRAVIRIAPRISSAAVSGSNTWTVLATGVPGNTAPLGDRLIVSMADPLGRSDQPDVLLTSIDMTPGSSPEILATLSAAPNRDKFGALPATHVASVAVHPDGHRLALCISDGGTASTWQVAERDIRWAERARLDAPLLRESAPISAMVYAAGGSRLVFLRDLPEGEREIGVLSTRADSQPLILQRGKLHINAAAVNPDSSLIAAIVTANSGESVLRVVRADSGAIVFEVAGVTDAAWTPNRDTLIIAAQDYRGQYQLWKLSPTAPDQPVQLTFLDGGIIPMVAVTRGGAFAAAPSATTQASAIVLVDLNGTETR